jgi:deoxycytidine triphosphate deaminase
MSLLPLPRSPHEFAQSIAEADERFSVYGSIDPYPSIAPALLNSADILDYARVTGMLFPFHTDAVKSASYEVTIEGSTYIYWDEDKNSHKIILKKGTEFTLYKNSIGFLQLATRIKLPSYIAIRFNLRITHVHRGLLLGTGPLVDPGFEGNLLIPLHNLTSEDYKLDGGTGLIWVEFTKLSNNSQWRKHEADLEGKKDDYRLFPEEKKNMTAETYLGKASNLRPIQSSISSAIKDVEKKVENLSTVANQAKSESQETEKKVNKIYSQVTIGGVVAAIGLFIALVFGFNSVLSLIQDTTSYLRSSKDDLNKLQEQVNVLQMQIDAMRSNSIAKPPISPAPSDKRKKP